MGNASPRSRRRRTSPVHPHARGERCVASNSEPRLIGSSPRTWGTPLAAYPATTYTRFIPTHVGNADFVRKQLWQVAVHPHARGERRSPLTRRRRTRGSSPRTWGTRILCENNCGKWRFIPTHVGNAHGRARTGRLRPVHPHARGERGFSDATVPANSGSSPRTWGTRSPRPVHARHLRFIPTHVGNAAARIFSCVGSTVHPHARGERRNYSYWQRKETGSSPRTWGTPGCDPSVVSYTRFIPTHVGNAYR